MPICVARMKVYYATYSGIIKIAQVITLKIQLIRIKWTKKHTRKSRKIKLNVNFDTHDRLFSNLAPWVGS